MRGRIFDKGVKAFSVGWHIETCPWDSDTKSYWEWMAGWYFGRGNKLVDKINRAKEALE